MIFPMISPQTTGITRDLPICREVAWNFAHNTPVFSAGIPVIVERLDAVMVWAWKALHTERFRYDVYTWNYGCEIMDLIGSPYTDELKLAEAARYVRECLLASPYITDVREVEVSFEGSKISLAFSIVTIYGEKRMEAKNIG